MLRRVALFVIVLSGIMSWSFSEAAAATSSDSVQEYTESTYQVDTAADGVARTLVEHRVVDRHGVQKSRETYRVENAAEQRGQGRPYADLPFTCYHQGYRAGFEPQPMKEIYEGAGRNDFVQFQFYPFRQATARPDPTSPGRWTQQWLFCGTGGVDSDNGSRLVISGPGVAYGSGDRTHRIGHLWKEGSTPASYSLSLGFATEGPVKVNGGVSQTPTKSLQGSPRPPYRHALDVFSRNAVNGWWEDSCAPDCIGTGGSTRFQGSVVEGLWEFPDAMSVMVSDFALSAWKKTFCSNPAGCRP